VKDQDYTRRAQCGQNTHFGRHVLSCRWNARTYFIMNYQNYWLSGPYDADDILNIKFTHIFQ